MVQIHAISLGLGDWEFESAIVQKDQKNHWENDGIKYSLLNAKKIKKDYIFVHKTYEPGAISFFFNSYMPGLKTELIFFFKGEEKSKL